MVQWEVLNSKNYGVPQNRERVYIVGHLRGSSRPEIFPIGESQKVSDKSRKKERKIGSELSSAITSNYKRGVHAMSESYIVEKANLKELTKNMSMGYRVYDSSGVSTTLRALGGGLGAKTGLYQVKACLTPDRKEKRQNGRRFKDNEEPMFTLTGQDKHGVMINSQIRRLTPTECERLQGFPDGWTDGISDTQRYKCLGNAVTTNVVCEIAKRLLK
jgi:DNA (cytosine-5)-methyltransferase 1